MFLKYLTILAVFCNLGLVFAAAAQKNLPYLLAAFSAMCYAFAFATTLGKDKKCLK